MTECARPSNLCVFYYVDAITLDSNSRVGTDKDTSALSVHIKCVIEIHSVLFGV